MMYQNFKPKPEGAISPKRSKPQLDLSSPHDHYRVWLQQPEMNIQARFKLSSRPLQGMASTARNEHTSWFSVSKFGRFELTGPSREFIGKVCDFRRKTRVP